jgi:hypothetical protein
MIRTMKRSILKHCVPLLLVWLDCFRTVIAFQSHNIHVTEEIGAFQSERSIHQRKTTTSILPTTRTITAAAAIRRTRVYGYAPKATTRPVERSTIWEDAAKVFHPPNFADDFDQTKAYTNTVSLLRVGVPSLFLAASAKISYPYVAIALANAINDSGVFAVVAQDASQYIQNVLTTSGLTFSILVGQTYYFMYQQQEAIYLALFEEVTMAKSLLEQVALVSQGRQELYERILGCVQDYVRDDLNKFNDIEPAVMISKRPCDDPLEEILYLTSVGEPSMVYQTLKSLKKARAARLGALQKKLPQIQIFLLWTLAAIVLFTFPLLGAGVQTIGGMGILVVQSWFLSFIVFGIGLVMGVIGELRRPGDTGAYNAGAVLKVMVEGLEEELDLRLRGVITGPPDLSREPSVDSDGYLTPETL